MSSDVPTTTSTITAAGAAAKASVADVVAVPGVPKPDPILTVDNVTRRFGGKTTFFNLITGFDKPSSAPKLIGGPKPGEAAKLTFNGRDVGNTGATKVAKMGMVRTFQLTKALSKLTVIENMRLGAKDQPGENLFVSVIKPLWAKREAEITAKAEDLLGRFKLLEKKDDMAG